MISFNAFAAPIPAAQRKPTSKTSKPSPQVENTFQTPDFAFPRDVDANARKALDSALAAGNDLDALRAAVQISVATNAVSRDSVLTPIRIFDNLSRSLKAPYANLALILEARLYVDVYNSNRWDFDRRVLPADNAPEDPMLWDRKIFRQKIQNLTEKAFADTAGFDRPLSDFYPLIDSQPKDNGLALIDFMTAQGINLLQTFRDNSDNLIPFGKAKANDSQELTPEILADRLIAYHQANDPTSTAMGIAICRRADLMSGKQKEAFLTEWFNTPGIDAAVVPVARDLFQDFYSSTWIGYARNFRDYFDGEEDEVDLEAPADTLMSARDFHAALGERADALAEKQAKYLKNLASLLETPGFSANLPGALVPDSALTLQLTRRNIKEGYLLIYRLTGLYENNQSVTLTDLFRKGKLVHSLKLPTLSAEMPFIEKTDFQLPPLKPGHYAVLYSSAPDKSGVVYDKYTSAGLMNVSAIQYLAVNSETSEENPDVYIVDSRTQKPLRDVTVKFKENGRDGVTKQSVTDTDGRVRSPFRNCEVSASFNGSNIKGDLYSYYNRRNKDNLSAALFTDLGIYHPGDTVQFAAVAYSKKNDLGSLAEGLPVTVYLRDANRQDIDSVKLVTDKSGRVSGSFTLPKSGLLGQWDIMLHYTSGKSGRGAKADDFRSYAYFEVADYKAPTFFVTVKATPQEDASSKTVKLTGEVQTYSGMPVADAAVKLSVNYSPWWFWGGGSPASYTTEATTDAQGRFEVDLDAAGLQGTQYMWGRFSYSASATSPAGETQTSPSVPFCLSKGYSIRANIPATIEVKGDNVELNAIVADMLDTPVVKQLEYTLTSADGQLVKKGEFTSPKLQLSAADLPSGKYKVEFRLAENAAEVKPVSADFILWRSSDKRPPVADILWMPVDESIARAGEKSSRIRVGNSYADNYLLVVVSDKNGVRSRQWIRPKGEIIEISAPNPEEGNRTWVKVSGLKDFTSKEQTFTILPPSAAETIKVETVTFRNRLTSGTPEKWSFRFMMNERPLGGVPSLAVMTDKALDSLAPFNWSLNQFGFYFDNPVNLTYDGFYSISVAPNLRRGNLLDWTEPGAEWNFYGYSLYGGYDRFASRKLGYRTMASNSITVRGAGAMTDDFVMEEAVSLSAPMMAMDMKESNMEIAADEDVNEADGGVETPDGGEAVKYREVSHPLAFFRPNLTADADGMLNLDFEVPDFNTTWRLQLLGYTPQLKYTRLQLEAVSAKKVMVQTTLPQFLRTSDRVVIAATLFNNSENAMPVGGRMEFFDPVSGNTLHSQDYPAEELAASASRVVTAEFTVPSDISTLGVRSVARGSDDAGTFTDAEQAFLPVLPAASPVIDSEVFYLAPGADDWQMKLPELRKDANVTLQYCDNPVWYCMTALPDIVNPQSESAWILSTALYGNCIGAGLMEKYPRLAEALRSVIDSDDKSLLTSQLQQNADLKSVELNNTPWVNDAAAETLRMSRLSSLLDRKGADRAISDVWNRLEKLRADGSGWRWCPQMKPSVFITTKVLTNLGMLCQMDYLPVDAKLAAEMVKAITEAVHFCDREILADYNHNPESFSFFGMCNYLYIRSFFDVADVNAAFTSLKKKGIAAVANDWRCYGQDIYMKATAAILLQRSQRGEVAKEIVNSLGQYSTYKTEKGRWWDNLVSGWSGWPKLITTTQSLEAFSEVDPQDEMVDQVRQWLVLQRQTEDWGRIWETAEVISAILTSGSEWTAPSAPSTLTLGGKPVAPSKTETLTGTFNITLDPAAASGETLQIHKNSHGPSWGGVISQYIAPMSEVKPASVPDLKLSKSFQLVTPTEQGDVATEATEFRKGDRVRVVLTIDCGRDMNYVALSDERCAGFLPCEQISDYLCTDGIWTYREVRFDKTSLFFEFLPKGKHVVSYDCYAQQDGTFSAGIATIQSQYAPLLTGHTAGQTITIK